MPHAPADTEAVTHALRQHPVLSQLDDGSLSALPAQLRLAHLDAGATVGDADTLARQLGLVVRGRLVWHATDGSRGPALATPAWLGAGVHPSAEGWTLQADGPAGSTALVAWADAATLTALRERQPWAKAEVD